jgi:hypothetical protein
MQDRQKFSKSSRVLTYGRKKTIAVGVAFTENGNWYEDYSTGFIIDYAYT